MKFTNISVYCIFYIIAHMMSVTEQRWKEENMNDYNKNLTACFIKTDTNVTTLHQGLRYKFNVDDEKIKMLVTCMMTKYGVLDADGKFSREAFMAKVDDEHKMEASQVLERCMRNYMSDGREDFWSLFKCYYKNGPV